MATSSPSDREVLISNIKPVHYDLSIFDLKLAGNFQYNGKVSIEVSVTEPTKTIELNSHELRISRAQIGGQLSKSVEYNEKLQRAYLTFADPIPLSQEAILEIDFSGIMNTDMAGFYRSKYKPATTPSRSVPVEGGNYLMFSTQFEACDARRAFPCFDEPNLKATFGVSLEIPDDLVALSNMPEEDVARTTTGLKTVRFQRTPKMSTYLLAWMVADLRYVETHTVRKYGGRSLPVRVYATPGHEHLGEFGAKVAAKVIDFYSDIFQIEYPLPKLDLVAVHEFTHNAMENWGLITYRTTAILYDPAKSDAKYQNKVAIVVAHELAHQWFGNLVTMDWWSELWLNEGFATWVSYYAVDHFFPEYQVWPSFLAEQFQTAQQLDGLRSSHPVEVGVKDAKEIDQVFDAISYLKGSSIIRMLVAHIGITKFLQGIAAYLQEHRYGNATTNDLWSALRDASGVDVATFMGKWIRNIGFPVITIAEEPGQIEVRQNRFLVSGDVEAAEDSTVWWIPLGLMNKQQESGHALSMKEETIRNIDETFYKFNRDQVGFYRTNYPPIRLAQLGADRAKLSVEDRVGLVADAAALAVAGLGTTASFLALVEHFQQEESYAVWTQILVSLTNVRSVFAHDLAVARALDAFALRLLTPAVEKVGWTSGYEDSYLSGQLRSLLITMAGAVGHEKTIEQAKKHFAAFQAGDANAIHQNLRSAVFRTAIAAGGKDEYDALKKEYFETTSYDTKEICLTCLGKTTDNKLANGLLAFLFSEVAVQDIHFGTASLGANPSTRHDLWEFIQKDWDKVQAALATRPIVMDRFIRTGLSKFASEETAQQIADFFKDKDTRGWDRAVTQVIDTVKANSKYRDRDAKLVLEWLQAHEYAWKGGCLNQESRE